MTKPSKQSNLGNSNNLVNGAVSKAPKASPRAQSQRKSQVKPQPSQSLPGQQPSSQAPTTQSDLAAAISSAIASINTIGQFSQDVGYQKGQELSQAMNQFPQAMRKGFEDHQQATGGLAGFGADLQNFQRDITALLESNAAPTFLEAESGHGIDRATPKAITAGTEATG